MLVGTKLEAEVRQLQDQLNAQRGIALGLLEDVAILKLAAQNWEEQAKVYAINVEYWRSRVADQVKEERDGNR